MLSEFNTKFAQYLDENLNEKLIQTHMKTKRDEFSKQTSKIVQAKEISEKFMENAKLIFMKE